MQDTSPSDLELAMVGRVRCHMLLSVLGVVVAIVSLGLVRWVGVKVFHGEPPGLYVLAYAPCFLLIPAIGLVSSRTNLRCPNCDGSVAWQVSGNAAAFAAMSQKNCTHCGKQIFGRTIQRKWRRTFVIVFVLTLLLFGAAGLSSAIR